MKAVTDCPIGFLLVLLCCMVIFSAEAQKKRTSIFEIKEKGDIFLDMRGWGKEIVFVNGHHLGRYWKIRPQQTGCWLNKGKNNITVFEMQNDVLQKVVKTTDKPILNQLQDDK